MPIGHPVRRTARDLGFLYGPIYGSDPMPDIGSAWFRKCMDARGEEMKQHARAHALEVALLEMIEDCLRLAKDWEEDRRRMINDMQQDRHERTQRENALCDEIRELRRRLVAIG